MNFNTGILWMKNVKRFTGRHSLSARRYEFRVILPPAGALPQGLLPPVLGSVAGRDMPLFTEIPETIYQDQFMGSVIAGQERCRCEVEGVTDLKTGGLVSEVKNYCIGGTVRQSE